MANVPSCRTLVPEARGGPGPLIADVHAGIPAPFMICFRGGDRKLEGKAAYWRQERATAKDQYQITKASDQMEKSRTRSQCRP